MTEQDQRIALAELDGFKPPSEADCEYWRVDHPYGPVGLAVYVGECCKRQIDKDYLTSYDAIIPLVQKQNDKIRWAVRNHLMLTHTEEYVFLDATPAQLSEALLRATGKWKE